MSIPFRGNDDSLGVQVKCASHSSWTTLSANETTVDCPLTDTSIGFRDKGDWEANWSENWDCAAGKPKWALGAKQIVTLTGELSICRSNTIRASSTCTWVPDPTLVDDRG